MFRPAFVRCGAWSLTAAALWLSLAVPADAGWFFKKRFRNCTPQCCPHCSCYYGYYPTCWQCWPEGWMDGCCCNPQTLGCEECLPGTELVTSPIPAPGTQEPAAAPAAEDKSPPPPETAPADPQPVPEIRAAPPNAPTAEPIPAPDSVQPESSSQLIEPPAIRIQPRTVHIQPRSVKLTGSASGWRAKRPARTSDSPWRWASSPGDSAVR